MNQVMAKESDDAQFWLPSEFLTDDDLLNDFKTNGLGINSDLSSPVESVIGSNETESDEDELTQKLVDALFTPEKKSYRQMLSSSPQSTLYGCKHESTRSSPNCVSSPPDSKGAAGWDELFAVVEEARRQRSLIDETSSFFSNSVYGPTTHKLNKVIGPVKSPNPYYSNQAHAQAEAEAYYSYTYTQRQLEMIRERENIVFGRRNAGAWPTLQQSQHMQPPPPPPRQRTGTGMRTVFLGDTGVRKERTGTGVFLPRRFENNVQKKPGCSVLLPEKVVHALNLNLDSMDSSSHTRSVAAADCGVGFHPQKNNVKFGQQMQGFRPQQQQQQQVKQELGLPQEWTY